jgi:hypothetical protein
MCKNHKLVSVWGLYRRTLMTAKMDRNTAATEEQNNVIKHWWKIVFIIIVIHLQTTAELSISVQYCNSVCFKKFPFVGYCKDI